MAHKAFVLAPPDAVAQIVQNDDEGQLQDQSAAGPPAAQEVCIL